MIHFKFHTSWLFIKLGMLQCLRNVLLKGFELFWIHAWSQNSECREMITYVPAAWSFTCDSERWILLVYFFVLFLHFLRKTDGSIHDDIFHLFPGTCMNLYVTVSCKLWESLKAFNHATGNAGWRVCFAAFSFSYLIDTSHITSYSYPLFLASAVGSAGRGSGSGCGRLLGQMAHSPQMGAELSVEMTWDECVYLYLSFVCLPVSILLLSTSRGFLTKAACWAWLPGWQAFCRCEELLFVTLAFQRVDERISTFTVAYYCSRLIAGATDWGLLGCWGCTNVFSISPKYKQKLQLLSEYIQSTYERPSQSVSLYLFLAVIDPCQSRPIRDDVAKFSMCDTVRDV